MSAFLKDVAEFVIAHHQRLEEVTLVFPNRRAALFFRKHLGMLLQKPAFAPRLLTIEDFFKRLSSLTEPDKLELISELHQVYNSELGHGDAGDLLSRFENFYFWGEMLLRDFDEVDKYLVDAGHLFKDLSHQKALDSGFDFLTDEQREFLRSFWANFDEHHSANKGKFLELWRKLPHIYETFRQRLMDKGLAFEGMLHRAVAEAASNNEIDTSGAPTMIFAGFNALTVAEERLLSAFVLSGSRVFWDVDAYYVNNVTQEAGRYFREYQQHPVLGRTFPEHIPSHDLLQRSGGNDPRIHIFGAVQPIGQAKLMAQVFGDALAGGMNPEETVVVLPDEKLLLPVMHGVASSVAHMNVTMGFPLTATPMFNFIELLIDLQLTRKDDHFHHRQVLALLGHPYMAAADAVKANTKRKEILRFNWVHIPQSFLASEVALHRVTFRDALADDTAHATLQQIDYVVSVVEAVAMLSAVGDLDKEYAFHFVKFLNRLRAVVSGEAVAESGSRGKRVSDIKLFLRLFRQLVRSQKVPFSGEPLSGLQIMGVLETRNLDFRNVFILSLNEGAFPAVGQTGSYIPYSIRRAYRLPTTEHQDAMYAYLFYRILQRAENVYIFHNAETDVLGQGETSRFLQQLIFESGLPVERKVLHNSISPKAVAPIVVQKSDMVMDALLKANEGSLHFKGISPSALNTYLECRLKFYFRHVAKIREADEVEEELDARVLGNFLHDVMERFYKSIVERKRSRLIEAGDFENYPEAVDALIDQAFVEAYRLNPAQKVEYHGQRLVVREIVSRFAHRIIEVDRGYVPFSMEGLEQSGLTFNVPISRPPHQAIIGGKIDRVDRKENTVRVIDYKTGKDKLSFESIQSLFAREPYRNKAAFQTLLYAVLYQKNFLNGTAPVQLVPGLLNRMNLFDDDFSFGLRLGKTLVTDAAPLLTEFESLLQALLEELFDPAVPFDQTGDRDVCRLCPYKHICYR